MTENVNPYDPDNFSKGGGFWDDEVVQVTFAKFVIKLMTQGKRGSADEKPWIDPKTKEQGTTNILQIKGIGTETEKEREEEYSIGAFIPTEGGEQCAHPKDPSKRLNETCAAAKLFRALKTAGFDTATLYPKISALVGQRFLMKAVPTLNKDGSVKQKNGYDVTKPYPVEVAGGAADAPVAQAAVAGNGLAEKADETIMALLAEADDNKLSRKDLVKQVSKTLAGDADSNKIVALIVRADYHKGKPWNYTGTEISL
jgi:hypothetical protein